MIKYLIGLLVSILAVAFIRAVTNMLMKGAKEALQQDAQPAASSNQPPESGTRLRKCNTCGTFAPETRMLRRSIREAEMFFCSKECEKKDA